MTYRVRPSGDGRLALEIPGSPATPLVPTGPSAFRAGPTTVRFDRAAGTMILTVSRIGEMRLVRR